LALPADITTAKYLNHFITTALSVVNNTVSLRWYSQLDKRNWFTAKLYLTSVLSAVVITATMLANVKMAGSSVSLHLHFRLQCQLTSALSANFIMVALSDSIS